MLCPDCLQAGISQKVELKDDECPECGGALCDGEWVSAPTYPKDFTTIMRAKKYSQLVKHNGVWMSLERAMDLG